MPSKRSPQENIEEQTNHWSLFYHVTKHRRSSDFCPTFIIQRQRWYNILHLVIHIYFGNIKNISQIKRNCLLNERIHILLKNNACFNLRFRFAWKQPTE